MRRLLRDPLFVTGVLLRLILLAIVLPQAATQWYVPFLEASLQHGTLDPWHTFIAEGGTPLAFPYGYVMWLAFLPLSMLCKIIGADAWWGYGLTLFLADLGMLWILRNLVPITDRMLLATYWLSPIVLFATYWLGLNDLIPVSLLCLALLNVRRLHLAAAGAFCGAAISAKLSMVLAIPLFLIYLFRNRALRSYLKPYLFGLGAAVAFFGVPFLLSQDALRMLLNNPEMGKVYELAIQIGDGVPLYILPMAYLLTTYLLWRIRRISFDLFLVLLGIVFFLVLLLTPASPGWFLWVIPLLIYYQATSGRVAIVLVGGFTAIYVATSFLAMPGPRLLGTDVADYLAIAANQLLGTRGLGLLRTVLISFGVVLVLRIWQQTVRKNEYFRLSRRPLVIGISGDSGSGKDTLTESLVGLFGSHSTVSMSGDDYHLWDRRKPMWQVMTHLNPRANDLEWFSRDLVSLVDGKPIHSRRYDHASGQMSKPRPVRSNDFIIASGLHALYLPTLRNCYDLSIYLDMDENLRRYFKLQRDVHERGGSAETVLASLDNREADSKQFVRSQAMYADLILSLQPIHPNVLENAGVKKDLRLKLVVRSRHVGHEASLVRVLVGVCGLHVDMILNDDSSEMQLTIEGETTADDISLAANELVPAMTEILDTKPQWEDGIKGLMQLIVLSHVNLALRRRLI